MSICLAVLQLSCGGGSSENAPASTPAATQPQGGSGTPGTPNDSHLSTRAWASVTEKVNFCDYYQCSGQNGFTVASNGNYLVGDGSYGSGQITPDELYALTAVANPVAAQTGAALSCSRTIMLPGAPGYTVIMAFSDGSTQQIMSIDTQYSCYYGKSSVDLALHEQMRKLEQKYDPVYNPNAAGPVNGY